MKRAAVLRALLLALLGCALLVGCAAPAAANGLPLKVVADVPLSGGVSRFDYQSLDPASGRLFVAHLGASLMTVFDVRAGTAVQDIPGIASVHGVLAVPALHRIYASATGDNQVAVIDERTLTVVQRIPVGEYPDGLAYDPDNGQLYVSDETGRTVSVIDTQKNAVVREIQIGGEVGNTQYDPAGKTIYTADQTDDQLVAIDPAGGRISARYDLPDCHGPHGFTIDPATHYALITCEDNARLVVFDLATKKVLSEDSVGDTPDVVTMVEGSHRLYVAAESGTMAVFEVTQGQVTKIGRGLLASSAHSVSVDPATHWVYVPLENVGGRPVLRVLEPTS